MTLANLPPLVTVFGGSGFIGRHVVRALAKRGYRIRVAVRRPDLAGFLQPLGNVGQISFVQANLRYRKSVDRAVRRRRLRRQLRRHPVRERAATPSRPCRSSAPALSRKRPAMRRRQADPHLGDRRRMRHRTRATPAPRAAPKRPILSIKPDAIIYRPSIVFGPEDSFFNKFADMARIAPVLPLDRRRQDQVPAGLCRRRRRGGRARRRRQGRRRQDLRTRRAGSADLPRMSRGHAAR